MKTVGEITQVLEARYPLARAEKWDKVGLHIGDEYSDVARVLVAHELTDETIEEAQRCGAQLMILYHPPIFRALENLDFKSHTVRLAARCIERNIAVWAAHTALDNAPPPDALGDFLAAQLGLQNIRVLSPSGREAFSKIAVFIPPDHFENVQNAMFAAGAGRIGNYDEAGFRVRGQGTFRPLEGANPFSGTIGKREEADEFRLEVLAKRSDENAIIAAMKAAHPYEEVAHEIYVLHNGGDFYGSARLGELPLSTQLAAFADAVRVSLNAPNVRVVAAENEVRKIACVPGSGASFIEAAARAGCDCLVTGDIKHHDALQARALGVSLIDATHTATERAAIELLAAPLRVLSDVVEITLSEVETNPFFRETR